MSWEQINPFGRFGDDDRQEVRGTMIANGRYNVIHVYWPKLPRYKKDKKGKGETYESPEECRRRPDNQKDLLSPELLNREHTQQMIYLTL